MNPPTTLLPARVPAARLKRTVCLPSRERSSNRGRRKVHAPRDRARQSSNWEDVSESARAFPQQLASPHRWAVAVTIVYSPPRLTRLFSILQVGCVIVKDGRVRFRPRARHQDHPHSLVLPAPLPQLLTRTTAPPALNPQVVGEGYHPKAGEPHAEVFALRAAGAEAEGATAYVRCGGGCRLVLACVSAAPLRSVASARRRSAFHLRVAPRPPQHLSPGVVWPSRGVPRSLEPCNHFGRTPPCSRALVAAKVKKVRAAPSRPPLVACTCPPLALVPALRRAIAAIGVMRTVHMPQHACTQVVVGFIDPDPRVSGGGALLRCAPVAVCIRSSRPPRCSRRSVFVFVSE